MHTGMYVLMCYRMIILEMLRSHEMLLDKNIKICKNS